jgi:hypothetical protein
MYTKPIKTRLIASDCLVCSFIFVPHLQKLLILFNLWGDKDMENKKF